MTLDSIVICTILDTEIMKRANMPAYFQNEIIKKYLDKIQDDYLDDEEENDENLQWPVRWPTSGRSL